MNRWTSFTNSTPRGPCWGVASERCIPCWRSPRKTRRLRPMRRRRATAPAGRTMSARSCRAPSACWPLIGSGRVRTSAIVPNNCWDARPSCWPRSRRWRRREWVRSACASTVTCTWVRLWCRETPTSSTSRASRRGCWPNAAPKSSPLRDVAGLLRSLDYLAASGIASGGAGQTDLARVRKQTAIERLHQVSEVACLAAYSQATKELPHHWRAADDWRRLLDLFLLEKAAYEINYEAANRPAWLGVPLRGLASIADRLLGSAAAGNPATDDSATRVAPPRRGGFSPCERE